MKGYDFISTLVKEKVFINNHLNLFDIFIKNYFGNKEVVGVEIGVLIASHANCLLHHMPSVKKLFLVDPYICYDKYNRSGLDVAFVLARKKLECYDGRKEFVTKKFQDAVGDIPDNLDFVYYDIFDDEDRIQSFLDLYYSKVRVGGVIGGWNFDAEHNGVARVVIPFADDMGLELEGVGSSWWFVKE